MADTPINLNKARKAKARTDKVRTANSNRAVHGLPKAARAAARARRLQADRNLHGKKRT